jgi:hypothetical protein
MKLAIEPTTQLFGQGIVDNFMFVQVQTNWIHDIITSDRVAVSSVIHNTTQQVELVALCIALRIHIMGDNIGSVLIGAPIRKFYLIGTCIHHGIGISRPQHGFIEISIVTSHTTSPDFVPIGTLTLELTC